MTKEKTETRSIMLAGVGGQGTILAAKVLSEGLKQMDFDVKMSEIHGMSQRGGSVTSHVRFGTKVFSPVIPEGAADAVCGFEKLEALRYISWLKPDGLIIVNDLETYPLPVLIGAAQYPEGILESIRNLRERCMIIPAHRMALDLGTSRVENIILLGALTASLSLDDHPWEDTIKDLVKPNFAEINLRAFEAGRSYAEKESI